jgi:hypothetical protein
MRGAEITGRSFSLRELFEDRITYSIDYYQREYAWSQEDVRTLVDDLCGEYEQYANDQRTGRPKRKSPPYFLGPFVYYEDRNRCRFLVDGQQRFTTLHLIFIVTLRLLDGVSAAAATDMLNHAIKIFDERGGMKFRIGIEERFPALNAFYDGQEYEPPQNATLSVRNLVIRGREIQEQLERRLDTEQRSGFAIWLMNHVVMVGIKAPSRDNAYRIFETMNDRGARLTSVDLLKSFLLSNADSDQASLNERWRKMLGELTTTRHDHDAPTRFIKAALFAKYARLGDSATFDRSQIDSALNVWVQRNKSLLGLAEGSSFSQFVDELIEMAVHYRTFLAASRKRDEHGELEAVYFNEVNGMQSQMVAILAAVRHDDPPTVAKDKASRIANFIDRWYVLRSIEDLPIQQRDLDGVIARILEALRLCKSAEDVTSILDRQISEEDTPFAAFKAFGYRGNNSHQVRYLLARITAHVAMSLTKPNEIEEYLNADRSWQIEHVFADHPERHPELTEPLAFRALRNRLGVLVLLRRRDNNSLGDLPYEEKVKTYSRQNDLAAILNPGHRDRNPDLRDFVKKNRIEGLFRSFTSRDTLERIATTRQELYLRLCEQIWDPRRLRICNPEPTAVSDDHTAGAALRATRKGGRRVHKKFLQTQLAQMVRAGVVRPGDRITGRHGGTDYWASIEDDGGVVLMATGVRYVRVDDAAKEVCRKGCKGMEFWHYEVSPGNCMSIRSLYDTRLGPNGANRQNNSRPNNRRRPPRRR